MVPSNSGQLSTHDIEDIECHLFALKIKSTGIAEVSGFAYVARDKWKSRVVGVRLSRDGVPPREFNVQNLTEARVNIHSKEVALDRGATAFNCHLDLRNLEQEPEASTFDRSWNLEVILESESHGVRSTDHVSIRSWSRGGAVQLNRAEYLTPDLMVQANWESGIAFNFARKAVVAEYYDVSGTLVHLGLRLRNFAGTHLCLRTGDQIIEEAELVTNSDGTFSSTIDLGVLADSRAESAYFLVRNAAESTRFVHYGPNPGTIMERLGGSGDLYLCRSPRSLLRVDRKHVPFTVNAISPCGSDLVELRGWLGSSRTGFGVRLASMAEGSPIAPVKNGEGGQFKTYVTLRDADSSRALRAGKYRIEILDAEGTAVAEGVAGKGLYQVFGSTAKGRKYSLTVSVGRGEQVTLRIENTLTDRERSKFGRASIRRSAQRVRTDKGTALFEAFNGRSGGDNPRPICERLIESDPTFDVFWAVADYSVEIPAFATPVVIHSEEYYRLVNSSELYVTNNWLPADTSSREAQTILQTWHGTPLKTLGLDRFHSGSEKQRLNMERMTSLWDGMVSQNPYSTELFRSCYAFGGRMLETGYPRNDLLVNGISDSERSSLRDQLGVRDGQKVLLYMPTWRENDSGIFKELQFERLCSALGTDWAVLVRGHSMTTKGEGNSLPSGLTDVSLFTNVSLLYLIADVLVTDYSSAMFDFSVTGKPMVFFAPDIENYRTKLRGMYFDLVCDGPGPLVTDTDSLVRSIRDLDSVSAEFSVKYSEWQSKFNPWDDGRSTERVVEFLLGRR